MIHMSGSILNKGCSEYMGITIIRNTVSLKKIAGISPQDCVYSRELGWFNDDESHFTRICHDPSLVPDDSDFETWLEAILGMLERKYGHLWKKAYP